MILAETATVWRCPKSRRRYLTRRSAYESWARRLIAARCECEAGDWIEGPGPYTCGLHEPEYFAKLKARLVRWLMWRDAIACERGVQ